MEYISVKVWAEMHGVSERTARNITDELKMFYYNGLRNQPMIKGYLMDTCLSAQDNFKILLDKFRIK